jgi:hypothetical protein
LLKPGTGFQYSKRKHPTVGNVNAEQILCGWCNAVSQVRRSASIQFAGSQQYLPLGIVVVYHNPACRDQARIVVGAMADDA